MNTDTINNEVLTLEGFDMDKVPLNTISSVFTEREKYIIIALTGKVGSGCTLVSDILKQRFSEIKLLCESPNQTGFRSDSARADRMLWRFYNEHNQNFHIIRVSDIITSFLLEDDAWNRISEFSENVLSDFKEKIKKNKNIEEHVACSGKDNSTILASLKAYNSKVFSVNSTHKISKSEEENNENLSQTYFYIKTILPLLAECIRNKMAEKYTHIYQEFGNELRFFGTLDVKKREFRIKEATNIYKPSNDSNEYDTTQNSSQNTIFTIAKRINQTIKLLQRPNDSEIKEPIAVVIDSMKNMYESNYLRDRYSAYYLFSISRDEEIRNKALLSDKRKKFTQDDIDTIDLNERPAVASKKLVKFATCFIKDIPEKYTSLRKYLQAIINKEANKLFAFCIDINKKEELKKEFCELSKENSLDFLVENTEELKPIYKDRGLTLSLCKYYYSILTDTLRVTLYLNDLYPFYLQDVETCIQNADILLTNNEDDAGPKYNLKMNLVRYISLMMHPGLVKPTPIERCMQIAYTAKVNSGCISRQVGAVVTDASYNILSLGWNDVPCGQTPCAYRNLIDLSRQFDKPAYSDYEWRKDSEFYSLLKKFDFSQAKENRNVLNGLPASFCFKKLNEDVTGEKNPMNARSMHGEEKALLQCDQQRVKGGYLFTTSSPCEMCAKNAKEHQISKIYYIEPYPGISQSHICSSGDNRAQLILFEGAIGRAYTQLYTPILPYKDELSVRGFPNKFKK